MKKDKADIANVGSAVAAAKTEFPLIDENLLKSRMYIIRGAKTIELYLTGICKLCIL